MAIQEGSELLVAGEARSSAAALVKWFSRHGLAGYDPFDVYDHPLMRRAQALADTRWGGRVWRRVYRFEQEHPRALRALLMNKPHENSKSVGLILGAWTRLTLAGIEPWPADGRVLVRWLERNRQPGYPGASWSYPWGYQSRIFFPAGTPWGIVTAICGEALLDYAELKSDEKALRLAREAAVFLAEAMPYVKAKTGGYLTYTPLDDFSIHNASISMGAYLARAAARFGEGGWAEIARGCLDFTVAAQEPDGSFDYWGDGQNVQRHVDNYHTGFVLRALLEYSELGYDSASEPLRRGWDYYQRTFVNSQGRPMTYADREVPVDIHGCAESILCGSALSLKFDDALNLAVRAARWTAQHLQNRDGSFGYGVFGHGKQSIAYTRWGESWMLRALSELCLSLAGASAPAGFTGDE